MKSDATSRALIARHRAAKRIADEAGELARRMFLDRKAGAYTLKGDQDYLTEADARVERLIVRRLASAFPGDVVFGEETGGEFADSCWVIDPIDGTANFARGNPFFCVSIAYVSRGRAAIGVINNPMQRELFAARRGGGATLNGRRIRVSGTRSMRRATVELGWSTRRSLKRYTAMVGGVFDTGAGVLRQGSGALGMAYVACGRTDGYGELHINSWDVLAGLVLVREAGGWTNDFLAGNGLRTGNPILACTPGIRAALGEATGLGA